MPRMPGAIWRPLADNWADMPRMKAWDIFCLHTMVGGLAGTDSYFRAGGYTGTESHFGVGPDGTIYQWQDTDFQADANYQGGWHVISSENADTGTGFPAWGGSDVPAFTAEQVEANARIAVWLHQTHGIPLDVIPDAKVGRRGIGFHRQGVPGYMVAGAELWSKSAGKVCPGDRRVAQVPLISARAKQLLTGGVQEEDVMASLDDVRNVVRAEIAAAREEDAQRIRQVLADGSLPYGLDALRRHLVALRADAGKPEAVTYIDPKALAAALLEQGLDLGGSPDEVAEAVVDKLAGKLAGAADTPA